MSNREKKLTMRNGNGICLLNDGQWVVMSNNKILPLKTSDDFWSAFPILEYSPQPTKEKLGDDFPYNELLKHALCSESKYWSSLALRWLEFISLDEKIKLKDILELIVLDKSHPQCSRHLARRYLKDM